MLAGEDFTDEPRCVCPVIADFLRTYNDEVDNERRQDLFEYASLVVETRDGPAGERRRANRMLDWWLAHTPSRFPTFRRLLWMLPPATAARDQEIAHRAARWAAAAPERHASALGMIESLTGRSPLRVDPAMAAQTERELVAP